MNHSQSQNDPSSFDRPAHTPGPWEVATDPEDYEFFSVFNNVGGTGAELAGRIGEEANARLIAAAPDLLAALQALRVAAAPYEDDPDLDRAKAAADTALARAKGEA